MHSQDFVHSCSAPTKTAQSTMLSPQNKATVPKCTILHPNMYSYSNQCSDIMHMKSENDTNDRHSCIN